MIHYLYAFGAVVVVMLLASVIFHKQAKRSIRMAKMLATDSRLPRHLRAMIVFGLLPIPGPVDNAVLVVAVVLVATRHRSLFRELINETRDQ